MSQRRLRLGAVGAAIAATTIVTVAPSPAFAAAPVFTAWPGARTPLPDPIGEAIPARLYMTTPGFSIPSAVAGLFTGIPVDGTMEFTGPDAIAGVDRDIQVSYDPHPTCNPQPNADPALNYVVATCPRIQLTLTTTDSEGGIRFGQALQTIVEAGGNRYRHPDGAVIEGLANPTGLNQIINFNGTETAVNDALADLVYEVGPDYRYQRYAPAGVTLKVFAGLNAQSVTGNIQIRVLDVNGFPTHDGPSATQAADAQLEYRMPDVATDPPMFTIADADNDEDVDDASDDPGLTTPPCPADDPTFDPEDDGPCSDPVDGANTKMLLIGILTCGEEIDPGTGFHFASSTFQYDALSIDDFFTDFLAGTPLDNPEVVAFREAAKAALDAVDPNIWSFELASVSPTDYTDLFVGFATFGEIQDALSQVFFKHNAPNDTCTLTTVVSDIGNNGLPIKYVVTDASIPVGFGWEVPMFGLEAVPGLGLHQTTITTGDLQEIEIGFDTAAITLNEGDPGDPGDPAEAIAGLVVSPTPHPAFTVRWDATPIFGDPVGPGQATPNDDFSGTSNNNILIPADDTSITEASHPGLSLPDETIFRDDDDEGNEVFTYELDLEANPSPLGYTIVAGGPQTVVVTIIDDDDAAASVTTFADVGRVEGDSGTANLTFTIGLDKPADGTESVGVTLVDGLATNPADYGNPNPTTVTFAPLATSATFTVPIVGDLADEGNHTFTAQLSNAVNLSLTDAQATGTITDDDAPRALTLGDLSQDEGNGGTTTFNFTVTLDAPAKGGEQFTWETQPTSPEQATVPADYTSVAPTVVTLADGQTSVTLPVSVVGNTTPEPNEQFRIQLSDLSTGLSLADGTGIGTIQNDDGVPSVSIGDEQLGETDADTTISFTITFSSPTLGGEHLEVTLADGTAASGSDYEPLPAPLVFDMLANETEVVVDVTISGDIDAENDETFAVNIGNATGVTVADGQAIGTIVNDDIEISIDPSASVVEGGSGPIAVHIEPADHPPFSIGLASTDLTAESTDYVALPTTLAIAADATTQNLTVTANQDADTDDETLDVTISPPASQPPNFTVRVASGAGSGTVTIVDDDQPTTVAIAPTATVSEGGAADTIAITRSNIANTCQVAVTTVDGSAVEPDDYAAIAGSLFAVNGDALSLSIVDDLDIETDQTFTITIVLTADPGNANCVLGNDVATVTITSDDLPMEISIADASVTEAAAGNKDVALTITNPISPFCDVVVTTTNGTAVAPGDFAAITGSSFNLASADVISIAVVDDPDDDDGETFTITVALDSEPDPRCVLVDPTATVTIVDDDGPADTTDPTVTINQAVGQPDPTNTGTVEFTVVFSEPVTGFGNTDIVLSGSANPLGATVTGPSPGTTYTVAVSPINNPGLVIANIAAGAAFDAASNPSEAATFTDNEVTFDLSGPTVTVEQAVGQADPTGTAPIHYTVTFSEPVTGFAPDDLTFGGTTAAGTLAGVITGTGPFDVAVSGMTGSGDVRLSVLAGAVADAAGNTSTASSSLDNLVVFQAPVPDTTSPTVTIEQAAGQLDPTGASPIMFSVLFSEPVAGFETGDVTLAGTAGATVATVAATADPLNYLVSVSGMTSSGTVIATIAAGVAGDGSSNPSEASTSVDNQVTFQVAPGPLTLNLPGAISRNTDPGKAGAVVNYPAVTASGGVPPIVVSCVPASGAFFPIGATIVQCTATDAEQDVDQALVSGSFTVTVVDNEAPVIADNGDIVRTTAGTSGIAVTYTNPTASDNSGTVSVACTPASGASFPIGTSTVTCTATDPAGNSASSSFTVTVNSSGGLPPTGSTPVPLAALAGLLLAVGGGLALGGSRRRAHRA